MSTIPVEISTNPIPVPEPRAVRLTDELRALPAGGSFVADDITVRCYSQWARKQGFRVTRRRLEDGRIRAWRVT